jgi:hypothetical protein
VCQGDEDGVPPVLPAVTGLTVCNSGASTTELIRRYWLPTADPVGMTSSAASTVAIAFVANTVATLLAAHWKPRKITRW